MPALLLRHTKAAATQSSSLSRPSGYDPQMPNPYSKTTRALETTGLRHWPGVLLCALLVLSAWLWWFAAGRVPVYQLSDNARLEVAGVPSPITAPLSGTVRVNHMHIGRAVQVGEVLLELDASTDSLIAAVAASELQDLQMRILALGRERAASATILGPETEGRESDRAAAQARQHEAETRARLAEEERQRTERLWQSRSVTADEYRKAVTEAEGRSAAATAAAATARTAGTDRQVRVLGRRVRLAELDRSLIELRGQRAAKEAQLQSLRHTQRMSAVPAPVSGRIAELSNLPAGSFVEAGHRIGTVLPEGRVHAVAFFPADALGRIKPSQTGRVRLAGFSWLEYGSLSARVARVAEEPDSGRFRVELDLAPQTDQAAPVMHGLPGTVAIEVDRLSPWRLALRNAGRLIRREDPDSTPGKGRTR